MTKCNIDLMTICRLCGYNEDVWCSCPLSKLKAAEEVTPPPTPPPSPESPCPKKIANYLREAWLNDPDLRGRRSLAEIFELVLDEDEYKRKNKKRRITAGKINKKR